MAGSHAEKGLVGARRLAMLAAATGALVAGALLSPGPAFASFHFAEISEILVGYDADPNVQYVEIQMEGGQNFIGNSELTVFDATGAYVTTHNLGVGSVPNGADEARWIMGTAEFDELVSPGAPQFVDRVVPAIMPAGGGMVCWGIAATNTNPYDYVDCIAYGTYDDVCTGGNPPHEPNCPSSPPKAQDVPSNCFQSLTRTIPATFDGMFPPNDTWADGNNETDFSLMAPTPTNNAGVTATMPTLADADLDLAPDCADPDDAVVDTDTDGCADGEEYKTLTSQGGRRNPSDINDFYDVPTPANGPNAADGKATLGATAARNKAVALTDTGVVLTYVGRTSANPAYTADNNSDGIMDGVQLDRTPSMIPGKPWRSGPPNSAVSLQDVGVNLSQVGHTCVVAP